MSNIALVYWLTRLSSISNLVSTAALIISFLFGLGILFYSISIASESYNDKTVEKHKQSRKWFTRRLWIPILLWVVAILTPNTKEAMLIIAGGKTLDYVQADTSLQKIPYKATEVILKKMDEYINNTGSKIMGDSSKDTTHTK